MPCWAGSYTDGREPRTPYPIDVSDDEWAFVAPSLTLMTDDAPQRAYTLREGFAARRWIVRAGAPWRVLPHEVPPWHTVDDQTSALAPCRCVRGDCP